MKIPFHKYYRPNVYLLGHQKRETEFLGSCSLLRQAGQLSSKEKMAKKKCKPLQSDNIGSPVKQLSLKQLPFKKANSKTANSKSANFKTATL